MPDLFHLGHLRQGNEGSVFGMHEYVAYSFRVHAVIFLEAHVNTKTASVEIQIVNDFTANGKFYYLLYLAHGNAVTRTGPAIGGSRRAWLERQCRRGCRVLT